MIATFHGGQLDGHTADTEAPPDQHPQPGAYRLDGTSYVWTPDTADPDAVHIRPGAPEGVQARPARRTVTRR